MAAVALAAALVAVAPAVGLADTAPEEMDATGRVVAALEESPVLVDPSFSGALPEDLAQEWGDRIEESGVPLRVLAVPLIEGGDWNGDPGVMAAAVHDRIGGDGHYLVLDGGRLSGHDLTAEGGEAAGSAFYGAATVSREMDYDAPAADQVERAVEVALSEDPEGIYSAAEDQRERGFLDWYYSLGWGWATVSVLLPWIVAALALGGLGAGVYYWRRPRRVPSLPQHAAFDNADRARRDDLSDRAGRELVELGERLSGAVPLAGEDDALGALQEALDAHAAARRIHDALPAEPELVDVAGVLVLLDMAEDHLERATRPAARRRSAPLRSHCYANPLHGTDTKVTRWREFGGSRHVSVPLCGPCARAVRDRRRPTVLAARHDGREVPYFEVPAEESVWAATGFGALRGDLVARVLRGDHAGRER
ncbi:hypothetical protein ACFXKD_05330 [Nocardiopsis aegyptia]|uniref:hypothetical protein n=1 Tax=Nocardiopsis aegyptia TaxID=220378 RepID=UPI0036733E68